MPLTLLNLLMTQFSRQLVPKSTERALNRLQSHVLLLTRESSRYVVVDQMTFKSTPAASRQTKITPSNNKMTASFFGRLKPQICDRKVLADLKVGLLVVVSSLPLHQYLSIGNDTGEAERESWMKHS
ncbi:hypothetical protein PoB_004519900 [Plakobranchus ocellatus]|uniref:Uncharacterized protein n=1 Tax=Plakobranchus ocellatus TaxID=259542 RepID=A0AAV4BF09_9GAST|nr:hypothetical protein PoB_004519900 [Plakobranchus ocellatus]